VRPASSGSLVYFVLEKSWTWPDRSRSNKNSNDVIGSYATPPSFGRGVVIGTLSRPVFDEPPDPSGRKTGIDPSARTSTRPRRARFARSTLGHERADDDDLGADAAQQSNAVPVDAPVGSRRPRWPPFALDVLDSSTVEEQTLFASVVIDRTVSLIASAKWILGVLCR